MKHRNINTGKRWIPNVIVWQENTLKKNDVWSIMNMHGKYFEWKVVCRRKICRREILGTRYSSATEIVCMSGKRRNLTASSTINWSGAKEKTDRESTNM